MTASMTSWSSRRASIATDCGRIDADDFHHPTRVTFTPYVQAEGNRCLRARRAGPDHPPTNPWSGRATHEIVEVGRRLREGLRKARWCRTPRPRRSCGQMDALRAQLGVRFPAP